MKKFDKLAWGVQKGNRVEYIHVGKKYIGTVITGSKAVYDCESEVEILSENGETHMVPTRNVRRLKVSNRKRKMDYAVKRGLI